MYLHVGNEMILNEKDIIGVFDIENASISKFTKEFLSRSQKAGAVVTVTSDIPKSLIVWEKDLPVPAGAGYAEKAAAPGALTSDFCFLQALQFTSENGGTES